MGIFSSIKNAIFGKKKVAEAAPQPTPAPVADAPAAMTQSHADVIDAPAPMEAVDVEAHLEDMADADGRDLNWRTSIVDLMKLLGMESSLAERKELADELGYTGEKDGSAEMNIWLHKAVMRELAANGGLVPASMLD